MHTKNTTNRTGARRLLVKDREAKKESRLQQSKRLGFNESNLRMWEKTNLLPENQHIRFALLRALGV